MGTQPLSPALSDDLVSDIRDLLKEYQGNDAWIDQRHQDTFCQYSAEFLRKVLLELNIPERCPEFIEGTIPF